MTTFTVTTSPSQLYMGQQGVVTLVNQGPSTVYLEDNPSISTLNSFALPPTGQMTWQGDRPMYGMTKRGESRLITSPAGNLSDTSRAKFLSTLYSSTDEVIVNGAGSETPLFEVAHCATISVSLDVTYDSVVVAGAVIRMFYYWYDTRDVLIDMDFGTMPVTGMNTTTYSTDVPVKGTYCKVQFYGASGNVTVVRNLTITGTDRVNPYKSSAANIVYAASADNQNGTLPYPNAFCSGSFTVEAVGVKPSSRIFLPSWGTHLSFYPVVTGTQDLTVSVYDYFSNRQTYFANLTSDSYRMNIILPSRKAVYLFFEGTFTSLSCYMTWPEEDRN